MYSYRVCHLYKDQILQYILGIKLPDLGHKLTQPVTLLDLTFLRLWPNDLRDMSDKNQVITQIKLSYKEFNKLSHQGKIQYFLGGIPTLSKQHWNLEDLFKENQ